LSPDLWGKKEKIEKKKIPDYSDEMRCRDSIGYEGKSVQEVGRFNEKTYEKLNGLGQVLGQE
jgi:hypothetical protein